jgi:hypothetical protein
MKRRILSQSAVTLREYARRELVVRPGNRSCGISSTSSRPLRIRMFTEPLTSVNQAWATTPIPMRVQAQATCNGL